MDILSNLLLKVFDGFVLPLMLPFLLIAVFLMMAGRKPDAAIDAGFGLLGALLSGFFKLLALPVKLAFKALSTQSRHPSPKYPPYKPGQGKNKY